MSPLRSLRTLTEPAPAAAPIAPFPMNAASRALEQRVVAQAQRGDGRITLALLQELGLGERGAERLLGDWRVRGWVLKDPARQNAHYLTPKLEALVGNRETRETP